MKINISNIALALLLFALATASSSFSAYAAWTHDLFNRKHDTSSDEFIVITPPKCGTYLISKALTLITQKKPQHYRDYSLKNIDAFFKALDSANVHNRYLVSHLPANRTIIDHLIARQCKIITIIRDPRDQILSAIPWILEGKDFDHLFNVPVKPFKLLPHEAQIDELITGQRFGFQLFDRLYRQHYGWLNLGPPHILVIKFEDLVGPDGGGSRDKQIAAIHQLAEWISSPLTASEAETIADTLFGASPTFRSGQINDWKEIFTEEQSSLFSELYRDDLDFLGYP